MNRMVLLRKRALIAAFDFVCILVIAAVLLAGFAQPAYAYVDPSVMTYTIQALAGVAVALSAVLGVAFRKTRKKLFKLLNIDENANKEVDAVWHRVDSHGAVIPNAADDALRDAAAKKAGKRGRSGDGRVKGDAPSWLRRFILSLITIGFCGFTLGIVAPFEIVAGSASSLKFGLGDIWTTMALFVGGAVLVLSLLLSLVRGKVFTFLLVLIFCGGLCCYVQAMFLNTGLPAADGSTVDYWSEHGTIMIASTVVWSVLLIAPPFISRLNRLRAQSIVAVLGVCLILVQSVGVASLFMSSDNSTSDASIEGEGPVQVTEDGLYEVSDKNNVIVFILDCFDARLMNQMLEDDPSIAEQFAGFTYYRNQAGGMIPTMWAIPNMLTGVLPQAGESIAEYQEERYGRGTFLADMESLNYSVGLYSDTMELDYLSESDIRDQIAQYTVNMHSTENYNLNQMGIISALTKCALYRDMPWLLKWRFWFYTDEVNQKVVQYSPDDAPENTVYTTDDPRYYERLQTLGLSIEEGDYDGAFRFIHLNGPHVPYSMDENAQFVGIDGSTQIQQAEGSLRIVQEYIQRMKDLGVYDDATIIVTTDHGEWVSSLEPPTEALAPMLMVKRSAKDTEMPDDFVISDSPVSQFDFQATVLECMGGDGSKYGDTYFEEFDANRLRDFYMITSDGRYTIDIIKYQISGDVLNLNNWTLTGESWHVNDPNDW